MSADVIARVRALAADFESRGDFATASDLLALCTAYAQVTADPFNCPSCANPEAKFAPASPVAREPGADFAQSFDAVVWAKAFVEHVNANPSIATDESTMVSWFANAIMRGYDEHTSRAAAPAPRECVLSWGVMAQDKQGQWCVWSSWPVDRGTSLLSVTDSPWHHVRCFADAEAIKAFAERAK